MTKADLVDLVYERIPRSKKEAAEAVDQVFAIIRDALARRERVKLSGFGAFVVHHKRARRGRNPQTGGKITIDSRCVLSFKPSDILKARVLNGAASGTKDGESAA